MSPETEETANLPDGDGGPGRRPVRPEGSQAEGPRADVDADDPALVPVRGAEEEIEPAAETALQGASAPGVLFVCVRNSGKSQMAAALLRRELAEAGRQEALIVDSAGTEPGERVNALSAEVLQEVGAEITAERPAQLTEHAMSQLGHVVVLGTEARVPEPEGVTVERWEIDEPSLRGIEGRERMELVRDDLHLRVRELKDRLLG